MPLKTFGFCFVLFMWIIFFEVFIEFVTALLLFYVLVFGPQGLWGLSSPTRHRTCTLEAELLTTGPLGKSLGYFLKSDLCFRPSFGTLDLGAQTFRFWAGLRSLWVLGSSLTKLEGEQNDLYYSF